MGYAQGTPALEFMRSWLKSRVVLLLFGLTVLSVIFILGFKPNKTGLKPGISKDELPDFVKCILKELRVSSASEVIWAHAVNSKARLAESLQSSALFLECDVLLRAKDGEPIIAHPPATDSDITLKEWISEISSSGKTVGIKLDFKETRAVEPSLTSLVSQLRKQKDCLLWLNADVLGHPEGRDKWPPVDPTGFLSVASSIFPNAVLSLGWSSVWDIDDMVRAMLQLAARVKQPVVFPVYEPLSRKYVKQIEGILKHSNYSVTLWRTPDREPDTAFVKMLTSKYPFRVFTDL